MWLSWKTFIKVLPWAVVFCLAKAGIHYLAFEPWPLDSLTGSLLGATTLALTIVLSGTLNDYRASESMPGQIVNALEAIHDRSVVLGKIDPNYDDRILLPPLAAVAGSVTDWLEQGQSFDAVVNSLDQLNANLSIVADLKQGMITIDRIQVEIARMRLIVNQMQAIRETDFVPAAYTLLFLFMTASSVTLLLIKSDTFSEGIVTSTCLFTLVLYLFLFIRDLDNPFEYDGKSEVDVNLSCLNKFRNRILSGSISDRCPQL
jgi:hypothetical protein